VNVYRPWSLAELVDDLETGHTTIDSVHKRARARISDTEDTVRAWVALGPEASVASAGALRGVPIGVKDIIDLRDFPTRCGSSIRADAPPARGDSAIVRAWRRAGAAPIGKTVTTEFAFFSPGPTGNPAAPGHTPGGSSSGSAAAVAAGHVPLALGSQTAGSVTRPASYCGVAALVMTHGRFATDGVVGLSESLDGHGVYAAGVRDLGVAWTALTGEHPPASSRKQILLWEAATMGDVSDAMADAVDRSAHLLRSAGAEVTQFPETTLVAELAEAHPVVMAYEAARERSKELEQAERLSGPFRALLERGSRISDADYAEASGLIRDGKARIRTLLDSGPTILGPAALGAAPAGLAVTGDPLLSRPWQALGLPVAAIPGRRDAQGLPLGLQAIAAPGTEARLLSDAAWMEDRIRS
jgi:Asp-tRNA(Asn)/Glu-tRNA(Gln) amidotransferase A subunit family amidase